MSDVTGLSAVSRSPIVPRGGAPLEAPAPEQPKASDRVGTSPEAEEAHLRRWLDEVSSQVPRADAPTLKAYLPKLEEWTRKPLAPGARSRVELTFSAVYGQLASLGVDRMSNGKEAFRHLRSAYDLAPTDPVPATSYGRTLTAFTQQSGIARAFIQSGLGIDIKQEARKASKSLIAHPHDPMAMLLAQRLASFTGDKELRARAEAALQQLPADQVARAQREIGQDAARAPEDAKR